MYLSIEILTTQANSRHLLHIDLHIQQFNYSLTKSIKKKQSFVPQQNKTTKLKYHK